MRFSVGFSHFFIIFSWFIGCRQQKILAAFLHSEEHPEWWPELQSGASSFEEFQAHQLLDVGDHLEISQKKGGDGVMTLSSFSTVRYQLSVTDA